MIRCENCPRVLYPYHFIYLMAYNVGAFVPAKLFQPSLIFAIQARAYTNAPL
jgi:hypothetical protein